MSDQLRRAVIRGDVAATGIALGVLAAVIGVSGVGVGPKVAGLVLLVAGLGIVGWSRRRYRELLVEVAQRFAGHDPGPSPVVWVSDAVWRARNGFHPVLDAANELVAEVDDTMPRFGAPTTRGLEAPVLRPVSDNERALVAAGAPSEPLPPAGTGAELLGLLQGTPGRLIGVGVRWPVCCGRLAVITSTTPEERAPGAVFLPEHAGQEAWDVDARRGLHGFECRACGRRYATDPAW